MFSLMIFKDMSQSACWMIRNPLYMYNTETRKCQNKEPHSELDAIDKWTVNVIKCDIESKRER